MSEAWLFGFQAELSAGHFASPDSLFHALDSEVARARRDTGAGNQHWMVWEQRPTDKVLLFPEDALAFLYFSAGGVDPTGLSTYQPATWKLAAHILANPPRNGRWLRHLQQALDQLVGRPEPSPQQQVKRPAGQGQPPVEALSDSWQERLMRALLGTLARPLIDQALEVGRRLAVQHGAWVVPGSLYAPAFEPDGHGGWRFRNDYSVETMFEQLKTKHRPEALGADLPRIYNQAPVFDPQGNLRAVFPKCFPTEIEFLLGVEGVSPREWNCLATGTALGRLGVLVCADAWYPPCYRRAARQETNVVLVPSLAMDRDIWFQPWKGFSNFQGFVPPYDRAAARELVDVSRKLGTTAPITEEGAWTCFALTGRLAEEVPTATAGMEVFACGDLFEWKLGARSVAVWTEGEVYHSRMSRSRVTATIDRPAFLAVKLVDGSVCSPGDVHVEPGA